ncbi:SOS response-associated peptidase [candidate division KSB1 bacterium]|nr:MAG: SOS response-associated peptidase [candidate division KSB1 bacterium]MCE7944309.1 SOS response-associated peptidase [Chlorobi bacterium CHB1]
MCGRYTNTAKLDAMQLRFDFDTDETDFVPRYNIAPTQYAPVLILDDSGNKRLEMMRWGLIPHWAKDASIGNRMINARSETIHEKPVFKSPFQKKRCLVLADGFYEWQKTGKTKQPLRLTLKNRQLFGMAGLWSRWKDANGKEIKTFTIITTAPNALMKKIHDRMPVIIPPDLEDAWLQGEDLDKLQGMLVAYPAKEMAAYEVSTIVNSPKNDIADCIKPKDT